MSGPELLRGRCYLSKFYPTIRLIGMNSTKSFHDMKKCRCFKNCKLLCNSSICLSNSTIRKQNYLSAQLYVTWWTKDASHKCHNVLSCRGQSSSEVCSHKFGSLTKSIQTSKLQALLSLLPLSTLPIIKPDHNKNRNQTFKGQNLWYYRVFLQSEKKEVFETIVLLKEGGI